MFEHITPAYSRLHSLAKHRYEVPLCLEDCIPDELLSNFLYKSIWCITSPSSPPTQEVELWEACRHGLIERVRDLLHTVHIDTANLVSISAF